MSNRRTTAVGALSGYMEQVELRKVRHSAFPLRDEVGLVDDLVASVMEKGLLEPIVVRPLDGGFEVVAGNRRLKACRKLGFSRIPCHIIELDDREAYEASLAENIDRQTLNPIEEARAFKRYVEQFGFGSASDLARKIGRSPSYVSRRVALLSLPEKIQNQLLLRSAKVGLAQELLSLDGDRRDEVTEFVAEMGGTKRSDVRKIVRLLNDERESAGPGEEKPSSYYGQEERKARTIERTLTKCITSLRMNMNRFDDALENLADDEDSWIVKEALVWQRRFMNDQADELLRLRKRFRMIFSSRL